MNARQTMKTIMQNTQSVNDEREFRQDAHMSILPYIFLTLLAPLHEKEAVELRSETVFLSYEGLRGVACSITSLACTVLPHMEERRESPMRNLSNPHGTAYAGSFQMDVCTTLPCQLTLRGSPTLTEINFIVLVSPRIYESESVTTRVEIRTFLDRIFFCIPS